ncbi:MAG: hypothetical protein U0L88_13765, partial [Acutalibacteraceae bacterium]|nr:hypothetical protein [Acutalibacteraceae bacterium]
YTIAFAMDKKIHTQMSRVAKDSYVFRTLSIAKGKRIERSYGFSLFSCTFLFISVHSTVEPSLSTIMVET